MTPPDAAWGAGAVALGLVLGSFANVCIHRLPSGESVVLPRSRCPGCGALIRWHDNVPVVSWILLGRRCRACGAAISPVYPLVEAAMAAGFLAAYLKFGPTIDAVAAAWLFFSCLVLTVIDARHFILPDALTLGGLAAGLVFAAARGAGFGAPGEGGAASFLGGFLDAEVRPLAALGGAATGAAIPLLARGFYLLVRRLRGGGTPPGAPDLAAGADEGAGATAEGPGTGRDLEQSGREAAGAGEEADDVAVAALAEGMGLGDVKMLAMVGAFLGPRLTLTALLLGSVGGCALVIPWLALTRRGFRTPVPFGPFIAGGAVAALFAGDAIAGWYGRFLGRLIS